jgi:hypothetical protein
MAIINTDVLVVGAGAAGLMCAATAGYRGKSVIVIDNGKKIGRKILISGGGRCNFTNENASPDNYLCQNPHFVKSALSRYTAQDFIDLVDRHGLAYHHKTLGQLFCDNSAQDIVDILITECEWAGVRIHLKTEFLAVEKSKQGYIVQTSTNNYHCQSLVIASGGLTLPKLGATPIGYQVAEQFGMSIIPTRAALVPLTLHQEDKTRFAQLSGVSLYCKVTSTSGISFTENILFTHRGLSGPAILQISSFWHSGQAISIDLLPNHNLAAIIQLWRQQSPQKSLKNLLITLLPKRFVEVLFTNKVLIDSAIVQLSNSQIDFICNYIHHWKILPNGTEGYRTAEVTLGGIDTNELSSKTFESIKSKGLYFIGEVIDVTGWLGGYNFQFAWSSGWACGQAL